MTKRLLLALVTVFALAARADETIPSPPQIEATAYFLMDAASGAVLAEHNADVQLPPASLTKMMTTYVLAKEMAAGRVRKDDMVVISENAWSQNPLFAGSSLMYIKPGVDVSVQDLEWGVVISSGNDATVALAEHLAGSEAVFAEMMNKAAQELGMTGSYFVNSHGLPDPRHLMTARDLAILSQAIITRYPEHYAIYKEREFTFNNIRQYNRNTLLGVDPTVDGLKTGHTAEAGYCLVASALRDEMRLIAVVMGTASTKARKEAAGSLLNYGFRFYETVEVFGAMHELEKPRIWKGQQDLVSVGLIDPTVLTLPRGKAKDLVTSVELDPQLVAPLAVGDRVGTFKLSAGDKTVYETPVVALQAVEAGGFFVRLWDTIVMWISALFAT
jgi:D-alanyl-D-alanine carboxypeptidase (penicillin-binding protein 5/6)